MRRKAIIFGIKGTRLTNSEKEILKKVNPWGVILFSRNIINISQLKYLVDDIKRIFNDKKYPILIDQEGGKVSRLNNLIDLSLFSQKLFGDLFIKDKNLFYHYFKIYIDSVSDIMNFVGININTVPVLDIIRKKSHKIIRSRSFSKDPNVVLQIGKICENFYNKNKIATVMKHIPGHGLAVTDSHYSLPQITEKKKILIKNDFKPFSVCKSLFAMTAHIIYSDYDPLYSATHSKIIINDVIRKEIGFKGILISDDISMKALKYGLENNTIMALNAGCNIVLHCNGNINEMHKISKIVPLIDKFTEKKTSHFYKFLG
tara:strand:- start:1557 stop:2504 length:948 start_codon:yes stop_codon:yes gene_type:complete